LFASREETVLEYFNLFAVTRTSLVPVACHAASLGCFFCVCVCVCVCV